MSASKSSSIQISDSSRGPVRHGGRKWGREGEGGGKKGSMEGERERGEAEEGVKSYTGDAPSRVVGSGSRQWNATLHVPSPPDNVVTMIFPDPTARPV